METLKRLDIVTNLIVEWQNKNGSIMPQYEMDAKIILFEVVGLVDEICFYIHQKEAAKAISKDICSWIDYGLTKQPSFKRTLKELKVPAHGYRFFFWGPLRLANAGKKRGYFIRTFLCQCDEPKELNDLINVYPHSKNICHPTHLLWGSREVINGNNVVFFPENIPYFEGVIKQEYALFFFNKHYKLYRDITLETISSIVTVNYEIKSNKLDKRQTYIARCIWGYLHDYFHHQGVRPFDKNIKVKTNRYTGLLEETKVDFQSYLACKQSNIIYADEISEFIVFERLFRYPQEQDYETNFDAGVGLFALSYFMGNGAIVVNEDRFEFDVSFDKIVGKMIMEIEQIEAIKDDEKYIDSAKDKVNQYLPLKDDTRTFVIPKRVATSPISSIVGRGTILKNLHDVGAMDIADQEWLKQNIPSVYIDHCEKRVN